MKKKLETDLSNLFIDYGNLVKLDNKMYKQFINAYELHEKDKTENPDKHIKLKTIPSVFCWSEEKCSCGFHYLDERD